jgi:hypothetical protein
VSEGGRSGPCDAATDTGEVEGKRALREVPTNVVDHVIESCSDSCIRRPRRRGDMDHGEFSVDQLVTECARSSHARGSATLVNEDDDADRALSGVGSILCRPDYRRDRQVTLPLTI